MGIKHFFYWFKNQFNEHMYKMRKRQTLDDINVGIDNLMIDMNGLYHNSAQKIYEYGNGKPKPHQMKGRSFKKRYKPHGLQAQLRLFEDVCKTIEELFKITKPKKRIILCVDGPAPISKQNQQRQRRFRSAMEAEDDAPFNSNCITPGTKFMDYLSKYIDWYIRKRITEDPEWKKVEVIFSSEKAPGEGEHKCFLIGTLILLWNGSTQAVEEIKIGDQVIGDDGTSRTVTELVSGEDEMYEIIQNNAENYTVNKYHILSLKIADHKLIYWSEKEGAWITGLYDRVKNCYRREQFSGLRENEKKWSNKDRTCADCDITYSTRETYANHMKKHHSITVPKMKTTVSKTKEEAKTEAQRFLSTISDDDVLDISVADYLQLPTNTQRKLYGFRSPGVEWPEKKVNIDPYLLGLWLGDGCRYGPTICTVDDEIVQFLNKFCDPGCGGPGNKSAFKSYNLIKNKHIPREYIVNNAETRLKVLAGIIDSDGNLTQEGRLIRISQCQKHKQLVDDIVCLARSLGFCVKAKSDEKKNGTFYQITISGDIDTIPTLISRKKCSHPGEKGRSIVVDELRTSIKVKYVGKDKYYGFNTDGNHRFLLGDFTVTHNCVQFIRNFGTPEETYCINGLDADLIMLALGTHMPNFYILREDLYDPRNEFFCIDIGKVRTSLSDKLRWVETKHKFDPKQAIDDFIFLCFTVGNDFLPHIPSIEIIESGIELILEVYKEIGTAYGHITETVAGRVQFLPVQMGVFFGTIGQHEQTNFQHKLGKKKSFFPDPLMESCATQTPDGKWKMDIEKYKTDYFTASFPDGTDEEKLCHEYFEGMQWVISYYTRGVPNWKWSFPYHYAPCASILAKHAATFKFPRYGRTIPTTPFQQLLCVLPPKSANLIPSPLCDLLTDAKSELKVHCPEDFEIDLSGKRKEWEGIVILPMVDFKLVKKCYDKVIDKVDASARKMNVTGRSFVYEYVPGLNTLFKSYYGDIEKCCVRVGMIDL